MTARERAEAMFTAACRHDDGYSQAQCPDCIAAAVEAAEASAYERAARAIDAACGEPGLLNDDGAILAPGDIADRVRALATQGDER
jgi:hypothetical protein